jgi:hypothetical protein
MLMDGLDSEDVAEDGVPVSLLSSAESGAAL